MATKTINTIYWVSTIVFAALMIFSSVGGLEPSQQSIDLMHGFLGYPLYFIRFISIAKLLGCIGILLPSLNRSLKEWLRQVCSLTWSEQFFQLLPLLANLTR